FFSSRRRHTRFSRDWSSDVCSSDLDNARVLSGMRPTGALHLGHLHGVLKNWIELQHEYECFFFVADWHALTTHYEEPGMIAEHRSEERRVGKEGRTGGWREQEKRGK